MTKAFSRIQMIEVQYYAEGYYDGRAIGAGVEEGLKRSGLTDTQFDEYRYAYKEGYDKGVADYCAIMLRDDEEQEI